MEIFNNVKTFSAVNEEEWRIWLQIHHETEKSIWLIIYKKESGIPSVYYPEAVNQALCFGWVDSAIRKRDEVSYYQYFAKRNKKSNWSAVNKEKVEQLLKLNLMAPAGLAMVELAKQSGTWDALNEVDNVVEPDDLLQLFNKNKTAFDNWKRFPRSARRGILEWILNAKKTETRTKRIKETVEKASLNIKANFPDILNKG